MGRFAEMPTALLPASAPLMLVAMRVWDPAAFRALRRPAQARSAASGLLNHTGSDAQESP
uniref:Uncharacterized protein n=1 Tax=Ralstonia syzygii R24 TaxID=907261 RepID=G3A9D1_9RALS|nr:hypothetical protein RALSY_mp10408 [Ralstonia syzygii R24]